MTSSKRNFMFTAAACARRAEDQAALSLAFNARNRRNKP
jgi:hypothetical protein